MNQVVGDTTIKKKAPENRIRVVGCTLFEGNFHYGVAALVNSLCSSGYTGIFYAGYRGDLPHWANGQPRFAVNNEVTIEFVLLQTDLHFTFCKPMLMNQVFDELAPAVDAVLYFDPDIVVKCSWIFFVNWVEDRVALCLDVNWHLHRSHPVRHDWDRYLKPHGFNPRHQLDGYCNAGFVGVSRSQKEFLASWSRIMEILAPLTGNRKCIANQTSDFCFHKMDQDTLNVAADLMPEAVSIVGPESMDFAEGGHTMSHAAGSLKPWRKAFLWDAVCGFPPSKADKEFLKNTREPIALFSTAEYAWRTVVLRLSAAIGRVIRRS